MREYANFRYLLKIFITPTGLKILTRGLLHNVGRDTSFILSGRMRGVTYEIEFFGGFYRKFNEYEGKNSSKKGTQLGAVPREHPRLGIF